MQIPADKRVRQYELTYLVPANLTSDESNQIEEAVEKLIKKHKGTTQTKEEWGKRPLAYTILHNGKRYTEALYKFMIVEFETSQAVGFEKDVYLNQQILRHLFVVAEAEKTSESVKPAVTE